MVKTYFKILLYILMTHFANGQITSFSHIKGGSELGFSVGTMWIGGDVKSNWSEGITNTIHWRKGLNSVWSIKLALQHGQAYGMNFMPTYDLQNAYPNTFEGYDENNPYFFAYKTNYSSFEFSNLFELTNLAPDVYLKNWNFYLGVGIGIANFKTDLDLKNDDNQVYTQLIPRTDFSIGNDYNTVSGRKAILAKLNAIYDHDYETPGPKKDGKFRLGDETNIQAHLMLNVGVSKKISNRFNLGLDYSARFSNNDLLDGLDKSIDLRTSGSDVVHALNVVLGFNLGKTHNTKPLYWLNPFSAIEKLINDQNLRSDSLWLDDDNDGVLNSIDKQANSMSDCQVDQFGVTLDSDKDGVPDCIDPNPFFNQKEFDFGLEQRLSQIEINTISNDVSIRSDSLSYLDQEQINRQILIAQLSKPIYFGLNQNKINKESKKHLLEVSKVLNKYNDFKLFIEGYASTDGQTSENYMLSKARSINTRDFLVEVLNVDPECINIEQFGEQNPIVKANNDSNSFLNRRVELTLYVDEK